jgi:hypothetical protein
VARPPETHDVCPLEQLSLQVSEHAALGGMPEHVCGEVHVDVDMTYRQPSLSCAHVATVRLSWHWVPFCVHAVATQVHEAAPDMSVEHAWWVPHVAVVTHCAHPPAPVRHVCTVLVTHCV